MGYGIGVLVGPRRTSVRTQLVAGMVALAAVAILASSLPAFGLIRSELERQAWNRLAGAASASEAWTTPMASVVVSMSAPLSMTLTSPAARPDERIRTSRSSS